MAKNFDGSPNKRYDRAPRRALREIHPGLTRTVLLVAVAAAVLYFAAHHLLH
jgi:hypothetical protein